MPSVVIDLHRQRSGLRQSLHRTEQNSLVEFNSLFNIARMIFAENSSPPCVFSTLLASQLVLIGKDSSEDFTTTKMIVQMKFITNNFIKYSPTRDEFSQRLEIVSEMKRVKNHRLQNESIIFARTRCELK